MTETPEIRGFLEPSPAMAHEAIKDLRPHRSYLSSDIYTRHVRIMAERGDEPITKVSFGKMLRKVGCVPGKKGFGKDARAAWRVTPEAQDPRWGTGEWP